MINLRTTFIALLLIIGIFLSSWTILLSRHTEKTIKETSQGQPDAYMESISLTVMNKAGNPVLKLRAPKAIHFSENDVTEITTPKVMVYRQTKEPWQITANEAKSIEGITKIIFKDHVLIRHLPDAENPLTTIQTTILTIFPDQKMAKTNEEITFTQPNTTIQAVGMLANWDKGTVKLLSQAREEYVPNS